jgi:chemotaxis protein CheD
VTLAERLPAGLGEIRVAREGEIIAYSLGSCVAVCLYDAMNRVGGMAHVVLPDSSLGSPRSPGHYADRAVPALVEALRHHGACRARLSARIAGGAAVLALGGKGMLPAIGLRNVQAVKAALALARVDITAEHTGGTQGRTIRMLLPGGQVFVRTAHSPEVEL